MTRRRIEFPLSFPAMPSDPPPVLIAACGNVMAGDDAFGPEVAAELRKTAPPGVEVMDLGAQPAGLVAALPGRAAVVILDAAAPRGELPRSQLIEFDFFDERRPPLVHDTGLSSHGLSIVHELELARSLDILPAAVRLIAAPAVCVEWGASMSDEVRRLVKPAARRAAELASRWLEAAP